MIAEIVLLVLAIPVGLLIAAMTRDELVEGRKWFKVIIIVGVAVGGWFYLTGDKAIAYTCLFGVIVAFVSLIKSKDKKWVKRRFS